MYFYYLFSITLYIRKAGISVLTTTAVIGVGLFLSKFLSAGGWKDFFSDPIALEFCFGLILAHFFHSQATGWAFLRYLWLPGLILLAGGAAFAENYGSTARLAPNVRYFAWGLPALLITASFIKTRFDKSFLTKVLLPVGDASFSIYLTHTTMMIVFAFLMKFHFIKPVAYPIVLPFLLVLVCLIFGLLVHHFIERPLLVWLRGFLISRNKQSHCIEQVNGREKIETSCPSEPTPTNENLRLRMLGRRV
jgi:exopolysaccharide production protein ExoZ